MSGYKTEQEEFWAVEFGDDYTERNTGLSMIARVIRPCASIIARTRQVKSIMEFGANRGLNLTGVRKPATLDIELSAGRLIQKRLRNLEAIKNLKIYNNPYWSFR